jgi:hypothetical protein
MGYSCCLHPATDFSATTILLHEWKTIPSEEFLIITPGHIQEARPLNPHQVICGNALW